MDSKQDIKTHAEANKDGHRLLSSLQSIKRQMQLRERYLTIWIKKTWEERASAKI